MLCCPSTSSVHFQWHPSKHLQLGPKSHVVCQSGSIVEQHGYRMCWQALGCTLSTAQTTHWDSLRYRKTKPATLKSKVKSCQVTVRRAKSVKIQSSTMWCHELWISERISISKHIKTSKPHHPPSITWQGSWVMLGPQRATSGRRRAYDEMLLQCGPRGPHCKFERQRLATTQGILSQTASRALAALRKIWGNLTVHSRSLNHGSIIQAIAEAWIIGDPNFLGWKKTTWNH